MIAATRSGADIGEDRLADAGSMERAARARPEEGADRLVRLDLADEHHAIILGDAEIGGLAGAFHQLLHDGASAVDQLAAPQERRAHAVGLDADRPELLGFVELDHAVTGERGQHAVGGRGGEVGPLGDFAERQPVGFGDDRQDLAARGRATAPRSARPAR